jgi:NAD(P)H-hydrate epimerase
MAAPKVGFFQGQSREVTGDVKVANLGTAAGLEELDGAKAYLVEERDVIVRLPEQKRTASKFTRGRVLVICGSRGMTGAAIMAGTTALRTGCGIVNVAVPKSERSLVAQAMPELLTIGLTEQENGAPDLPAWDELAEAIGHADVILVGSGLRPWSGTAELLRKIVTEVDKPMVVDAGALRALVGQTSLLKDRKAATIVTPHSGELASLLERQWEEVDRDRFSAARGFAEEHGVVVAMKGAPTYTFDVDGTAYINSTGNAGLATAGSGDVLAGILVGVLAQMPANALNACMVGVYLHGLAGDLAAREKTQLGMTATDLTHMLPNAFKQLGAQ